MKQFNEDFKNKLYKIISDIEDNSLVEIVTIVRQQSASYKDVGLTVATIATAIIFTIMMFVPVNIDVYLIYLITICFFFLSFFGVMISSSLLRFFISEKTIKKNVEIMARAIFQKGGIRFTKDRIGVLFFVSFFEKKVYIIPDRGAKLAVPEDDWGEIENQFSTIFKNSSVADNLLKSLTETKHIFNKYIPPVENDINELSDNLEVDI